jgi:hypothetical protein
MKERIFTNWTFSRMLFLIMGVMVIVQSAMSHQWFGILFGGYFAAMGLFAFGCAAGGCFGGNCNTISPSSASTKTDEVEFEEVQSK